MVNVVRLLAQFLAIPILSRILSPSDYGVVAMAMPFVLFAMMIADAGIGMSLVRTPKSDHRSWSTCFWLSVILGLVLSAIMLAFAPLSSYLFEEPRLGPIVMVLALVVFIQSICVIPGAELQQSQQFKKLAATDVIAVALGIAVAVVSATHGAGAWALVFQQLAFYGTRLFLIFWFSTFRPQFTFDISHVMEHILFGRSVLSVNIINFITRSVDNLVIGKVLLAAAVGVYSMAFQFARLPMMVVSGPLQYVFYSKLAKVKEDKVAVRTTFLLLTRLLAIVILPSMGMVAVVYEPFFTLLLSQKWVASGRVFMFIAAGTGFQAVQGVCNTIRLVLGRTDYQLRNTIEVGVLWMAALLISVWFGLEWVALSYSILFTLYVPRNLQLTLPLIDCPMGDYFRAIAAPVAATIVATLSFEGLQREVPMGDWMQLFVAAAFLGVTLVASTLVQRKALMREIQFMRTSGMH